MTDVFTRKKRSDVMSRIRGKDTKPELLVRRYLHGLGFRFRLHKKGVPGRPDLWLARHNTAIFVNGCYWHRHQGCKLCTTPGTDTAKWQEKFDQNVARDERNLKALNNLGIRVLIVWECQLKTEKMAKQTLPKIARWLTSKSRYSETPTPSH